jgi:tetratricopeptide (TPR) repeat protein
MLKLAFCARMGIKALLCCLLCCTAFAQEQMKIDSLQRRLKAETADTAQIKVLRELSLIASKTNLHEALDYSKQALAIAEKMQRPKEIANAHIWIGGNLIFLGQYDESLKSFLQAQKLAESLGDEALLFQVLHNIGVIKDRLQLFDEALDYFFKSLALLEKNIQQPHFAHLKNSYPTVYNSIGNIYESKKDFQSAKEYYLKGYEMAKGKDLEVFGTLCNNLGKLEIGLKQYESAMQYLNESLAFRKGRNDTHGMAKTYTFLALYYKEQKAYTKAIECANMAMEMSQQANALHAMQNAALIASEIYEQIPDFEKSLEYFKYYKSYTDSLFNDKKYSEIARLQLEYEHEIKQKELEVEQQQVRFKLVLTSLSLLLGLIIVGLLYFLSRSRHKQIRLEKEKLEDSMQLKNKELTTNAMYLLQKNELIESVTKKLMAFKERLDSDNKKELHKIILDLQSIADKEVWEEFEMRFQHVHEDFYKNLKAKFPDLTPSEIKLAAFLRLNMTSKDIASITGQSINSLENARYRLRKKLGITNQEVNLVTFLLEI